MSASKVQVNFGLFTIDSLGSFVLPRSWLLEFGFLGWGCQLELGRVVECDLEAPLPTRNFAAVVAKTTCDADRVAGQGFGEIHAEGSNRLRIDIGRDPDQDGVRAGLPRQLDVGGITCVHQRDILDAALNGDLIAKARQDRRSVLSMAVVFLPKLAHRGVG